MNKKYQNLRPKSILVVSISLALLSSGCSANQAESKSAAKKEAVSVKNKPTTIPMAEMKRMTKQQQILWPDRT